MKTKLLPLALAVLTLGAASQIHAMFNYYDGAILALRLENEERIHRGIAYEIEATKYNNLIAQSILHDKITYTVTPSARLEISTISNAVAQQTTIQIPVRITAAEHPDFQNNATITVPAPFSREPFLRFDGQFVTHPTNGLDTAIIAQVNTAVDKANIQLLFSDMKSAAE